MSNFPTKAGIVFDRCVPVLTYTYNETNRALSSSQKASFKSNSLNYVSKSSKTVRLPPENLITSKKITFVEIFLFVFLSGIDHSSDKMYG